MNKGISSIFLLFLASLWACSPEGRAGKEANSNDINSSSVEGIWNFSMKYMGENLELKPDGEFVYRTMSCMSNNYASGTWQLKDSLLILNSFRQHDPGWTRTHPLLGAFKSHGSLEAGDLSVELELPPPMDPDTLFFEAKTYLVTDSELVPMHENSPNPMKRASD